MVEATPGPLLSPRALVEGMRVLFVNEGLGGHVTLHHNLRQALAAWPEVDAEFLDVPRAGPARRLASVAVPGLAALDADLHVLRSQLALSASAHQLLRRALRGGPRPDVVHVYTQHAALTSTRLLREIRSVVSTDCSATQLSASLPQREPGRFTDRSLAAVRRFERRVLEAATLVVAQSEWAARSLVETAGVERRRLHVIPFGIMPFEAPAPVPTELPEITFVGTRLERKGGFELVRVFRRHLARRARLNLVTRDDVPPEPGISVYRDFVPGDPRLLELLARTTVFALPSHIDKSPYAIVEAMFAALPVVSTRVAAIPELVEDGVTGLLVDPNDDDALLDALEQLVTDLDRARALGRAGRERALARFDARQTTARLLEVLAAARG